MIADMVNSVGTAADQPYPPTLPRDGGGGEGGGRYWSGGGGDGTGVEFQFTEQELQNIEPKRGIIYTFTLH